MTRKLTEEDRVVFEQKEASRERQRQLVAEGKASFDDLNRANALSTSVIHLYRVGKGRGLPR